MNVHILQLKCVLRPFLITSFRTALRSHHFLHSIYYDLKLQLTGFQKVSWLLHGKVRIETQVGLTQTFNIYMLDILHTLAEFVLIPTL